MRATIIGTIGAAIMASVSPGLGHASPSAEPTTSCADIEVIFARGTFEPAGVDAVGQAFAEALQARSGTQSVEVYAVNYPASLDFARAADGVIDAGNRVRDIAAWCPRTKIVVGGYSQGAAVAAYLTADTLPVGYALPQGITDTLPPEAAAHIDAVALIGKPSRAFLNVIYRDAPPIAIGAAFGDKTIDLCAAGDPVCAVGGGDRAAHSAYLVNGMTDAAAEFASARLTGRP
ncbi:cutinase family protein [Mycobacterium sp. BMJ-28]